MTEYIILCRTDMLALCDDKPVTFYVDSKPYVLCTDEYFEKQKTENDTEVWNGINGQMIMPKGTFEKIYNDAEEEDDDI